MRVPAVGNPVTWVITYKKRGGVMKVKLAAAAAACVVGGLLVPAAPAAAVGGVECGQVISQNVVLMKNLTCAGNGLLITAGTNVTVDLNGHTIRGSGTGVAISNDTSGYSRYIAGLTVRNGTITGFNTGVDARFIGTGSCSTPTGQVQLDSVRMLNNGTGLTTHFICGAPLSVISNSLFRGNTSAGAVVTQAAVTNSTFDHNGIGLANYGSGSVAGPADVTDSTFTSNGKGVTCWDGAVDIASSSFRDNTVGVGGPVGRSTYICYPLTVTDSSFSGSLVGISHSYVSQGGITGSKFTDSTVGIEMLAAPATDYTVAGNTFADNGAAGLYLDAFAPSASWPPIPITGNTFKDNGFAPAGWVTPSGSPLNAGLWTNTGLLTDNVAKDNAGYGIEAYGVVDGGSNIAKGNGAPGQCLGITCTGSVEH